MAQIVGGLASSHTPTIGFAVDTNKEDDPVWAPIFADYAPVRQWLADKQPDVLFFIYNDHVTSFFFDHYSHFALGIGEKFPVADEGGGPRKLPAIDGHPRLAQHIANSLVADEFDLSFFQGKGLDHGVFSPLSLMWPHENGWPGAIVPLQVGVLEFPIPTARRCFALGRALRRAIHSYPEDLRVAIVGTGGLAHQVHGERTGFNNTPWDIEFLDRLTENPESLLDTTIAEFAKRGGVEGAEVVMWLIMRGTLSEKVNRVHQSYYLPSMTPICSLIFEEADASEGRESAAEQQARSDAELAGIKNLEGSYPFTIDRSVKAFRINSFLHRIIEPATRARFLEDEEGLYADSDLTEEEKELIRRRDWRRLVHYGVIFFLLEKLAAAVGVTSQQVYAAMRGETVEEFQATRNVQMEYSVAGEKLEEFDRGND